MDNALQQLIDAIKSVAPAVWEMSVRQVYVEAIQNGAWAFLCLAGAIVLGVVMRKKWDDWEDDILSLPRLFSVMGLIGLVLFFVVSTVDAVSRLVNPNWYAVHLLLSAGK